MTKKKKPEYILIPIDEFEALGKVSGEALRLYMAISAYAFKNAVVCWPKWEQISELMGPNKHGKMRHKTSFTRSIKELEKYGLVKRGKWGGDRFILTHKKKRVQAYFKGLEENSEESSEGSTNRISEVDESYTPEVDKTTSQGIQNEDPEYTNCIPVKSNKKSNKKNNIRDYSSNEKKEIDFRPLPTDQHELWLMLCKMEEGQKRFLHQYNPEEVKDWYDDVCSRWPYQFPKSKKAMMEFYNNWNPEDYQ